MERFDANCFSGNWPFFRVRENTVQKLQAQHKKYGITGGYISALEAIFYQDPYEAELQLSEQLRQTNYQHAMILNPTLPAWREDLKRCVEQLGIRAVRIMPGFHGYSLRDPIMDEVLLQLRAYSLPLLLTLRMHDERTGWLLPPVIVPVEEIAYFLKRCSSIPVLLNHIRIHELDKLNDLGVAWDCVFVDTAGLKDGGNPVQSAMERDYLQGHILYGSGAPLLEMYVTVLQAEQADLAKKNKTDLFAAKNFLNMLTK